MLQNNGMQFLAYASVTVTLYTACSAQGIPNYGMLFYEPFGVKKILYKHIPNYQLLCHYKHCNVCTWL